MAVNPETRHDREAMFLRGVEAFNRRDVRTLEQTMHPDIVMHVPGTSWLAGIYQGPEQVSRCILGLRQILRTSPDNASYLHDEQHMIVTHTLQVQGPLHETEMTFVVAIAFTDDGRVKAVSVEPSDLGFFDHVANTALEAFGRSRFDDPASG
jgi:ketosteroid isomerase-like protein